MAGALHDMKEEEKEIEDEMTRLSNRHDSDISSLTRLYSFATVLSDDIRQIEDLLQVVMTRVVPARLSVYLSFKSGLKFPLSFCYVSHSETSSGVSVQYMGVLYRETEVLSWEGGADYIVVQTRDRRYLLHPGHSPDAPLSEKEV